MRTVSMDVFALLLILSSICIFHNAVEARKTTISREKDLELEWQRKLRNQTPVKTIKTSAGLYDCIDIKEQPALKHPKLHNHEIRMKPTFLPTQMVSETASSRKTAITTTLTSMDCPHGTVPIRRYKKEALIRAQSFSDSHVSYFHPMTKEYPGQHLAILASTFRERQYGIRAAISLHNPILNDPSQASMAEMWVQSDPGDQMNGLQAGWIVSRQLNGDNRTHMFTLTTTNSYKTSCFNTLCGSFIQTDSQYPVDAELKLISEMRGKQYTLDLAIIQDKVTRDWWVVIDGTIHVGYFPASIFTQLSGGGTYIAWGGLTRSPVGMPSPPMGTGHEEFGFMDFTIIASFSKLQTFDASYNFIDPNRHHLKTYTDSLCYKIKYFGKYKDIGHMFMYGGYGQIGPKTCGI